jgi:membrane fusion protein (multidrug efflux system)
MRTFVILGIILIAVSIVGAKWALDHQSPAAATKNGTDANLPPNKIICWGFFDVEGGVVGLDPRQFGDIVELESENKPVKKGAVLLRVDDKLSVLKIDEAQADVKAADQQVAEARHLTKDYQLQRRQQEAAIRALGHESATLELKRDREVLPLENKKLTDTIKKFYVEALAGVAEKKKAEQAKLERLELQDANLKINQAEADLEAKKVRLKQAQEILKHFQVVAPSDGTVLRVNVRKGETLGPSPLRHAVEFLPDAPIIVKAEVLQEWGRFIKEKQRVEIEDDTYNGPTWKGEVKKISKWYAPTRSPVIEPLRYNDVRTLECIIKVDGAVGDSKLIGQRVRAKVIISP